MIRRWPRSRRPRHSHTTRSLLAPRIVTLADSWQAVAAAATSRVSFKSALFGSWVHSLPSGFRILSGARR